MRIESIETFILKVPLGEKRFFSSQCAFPARNSLLVRIRTDAGITGWGEGGQYGPPEPVATCINAVLAPRILGRDPKQPRRIWEELYAATRDFGQKGTYIEAISAIDIALWDILGQAVGEPVHLLLGGAFRDSIHAYATGCYYRGEEYLDHTASIPQLVEEARSYVSAGFDMLKIKVGLLTVEADLERAAAIREAIGPEIKLMVDANHAYNAFTALRMGRGLEELDVTWFEEPVPPEDHEGYRRVREGLEIAIAGGECEFTRYGFKTFLSTGCVDIAQPDLCAAGGFSEWQNIQSLASSFGTWVIPHVWGSGVALAAALHVLATIPPFPHTANVIPLQNEPVIEFDRNPNALRDDLLVKPIELVGQQVPVPQGDGLGIEIDETALMAFCQSRERSTADSL
ncbi:MAG: mandelate racemase/muconate lactonizing enzyme family protein [Chloroflexota bacterium]|nr:mandelate racemase/muconate lactonizing enzyme family protein [Chloroflexota bacterium]